MSSTKHTSMLSNLLVFEDVHHQGMLDATIEYPQECIHGEIRKILWEPSSYLELCYH